MSFDPYIHFQGNCRAAMTAYRQIFGGTVTFSTYAEAPDAGEEARGSDRVIGFGPFGLGLDALLT